MRVFYIGLVAGMTFLSARADQLTPDFCSMPLGFQASPKDVADWKCRCSMQILDAERIKQATSALVSKIEESSWHAKYANALDQIVSLHKQVSDLKAELETFKKRRR